MPKKYFLTIVFVLLLSVFFSAPLAAGVDYQIDLTSRFIWRGFDLNPQNKPALQPGVTFSCGDSGLSLNIWSSFSLVAKELDEVDVTLTYNVPLSEEIAVTVGIIHYGWYFVDGFTFKDNTTQELFVTAGFPKWALAPKLSIYYDIANGDGLYAQLAIGHSVALSGELALELSASLGYNDELWIADSGLSDLQFGASVPFKTGRVTISPFVKITFVLLDAVNPGDSSEFWGGVSIIF